MNNTDTKFWFLRDHKFFKTISNSELKEICLITNFKSAKKNEKISFVDTEEQRVYFLKKGTIKIIEIDEKGNEVLKDILQKGDIFGENVVIGEQNENEFAQAISDSVTLCSFSKENFEKVISKNPNLSLNYSKWMGFKLRKLQSKYSNLMFKDVRTRLIHFLQDWVDKESTPNNQNEIVLKNYLTHQDIASLVCSTRQTVTQLMNEFKENNWIDYSRTEIEIKDKRALFGQLSDN